MNAADSPAPERMHVGTMWNGAVVTVTRRSGEHGARRGAGGHEPGSGLPVSVFQRSRPRFQKDVF